jgi:hypothetical protein
MCFRRLLSAYLLLAFCMALPCLSGCGGRQATVKGKVTFQGKLLTAGTIAIVGKDNRIEHGYINKDGTYEVKNAPVGEVTITVQTPPPAGGGMPPPSPPPGVKNPGLPQMPKEMIPADYEGSMGQAKNVVAVPAKYGKVETSDLKYTLKSGTQTIDIDLKP